MLFSALPLITLSFILGISFKKLTLGVFVVLFIVFGIATIIFFKKIKFKINAGKKVLFGCAFFFIFGHIYITFLTIERSNEIANISKKKLLTNEWVIPLESIYDEQTKQVKVKRLNDSHTYILRIPKNQEPKSIKYGYKYLVSGSINQPEPPRNPGQFDYKKYLFNKNIKGIIRATKLSSETSYQINPFKCIAFWLKEKVLNFHKRALPYPFSDLFTGLIFGEHGTHLPEKMNDRYQKTGLSHLLVVSGSQVAILSGTMFNLLKMLHFRKHLLFGCIGVINVLFYFLTGGGASILRAALMNTLMVGTTIFNYRLPSVHGLCIIGIGILLWDPFFLFDIGAQLSFLATISLVFGVPILVKILPFKKFPLIQTTLGLSLSPFILTSPLLWLQFNTISMISILSNIIITPFIEGLVVVGFFSTIIGVVIEPIGHFILQGCLLIMWILEWTVTQLTKFPYGMISAQINASMSVTIYISISLFFYFIKKNSIKKAVIAILIPIFLFAVLTTYNEFKKHPLIITYLDVGQGDCTVIQTPRKKTIIIDTGGLKLNIKTKEIIQIESKRTLIPFLNSQGINTIDAVIITHYDLDHVGGLETLVNEKNVKMLIDNGSYSKYISNTIIDSIPSRHSIHSAIKLDLGDIYFEFFHPVNMPGYAPSSENNKSVVVKLTYKNFSALFTGDLEKAGENFLTRYYSDMLYADILKIGHHGSITSTTETFLTLVKPKAAIISAGRRNRYGHPHPSVIERLNNHQIPVFGTYSHGAVQVKVDKKSNVLLKSFL